jgi:hypothetical protein
VLSFLGCEAHHANAKHLEKPLVFLPEFGITSGLQESHTKMGAFSDLF